MSGAPNQVAGNTAARVRIVAGARRHFFSHGFRGVTMDDLAGELGMSKKTLYAHFTSKTALVEAVLVDKFRTVEADLKATAASTPKDFLEALHELLACLQSHMGEIQPPFVRDMRREAPELFQTVEARRAALIQKYFGAAFQRGQRGGIIRRDVPHQLILEVLLSAVQGIMNPTKIEQLGLTPKDGFSSIIKVVLEGAFTRKARVSL